MRRSLSKLAFFILLGAIVNLAVAYSSVFLFREYDSVKIQTIKYLDGDSQKLISNKSFCSEQIFYDHLQMTSHRLANKFPGEVISASPFDWSRLRRHCPKEFVVFQECAHGWPLYCLKWYANYGEIKGGFEFGEPSTYKQVINSWNGKSSNQMQTLTVVPYLPIWKGLIFNTLFYAALLWLLTLGPFDVRRMIRLKRGHCTKCGYDLRSDFEAGCPECGWGRKAEA